MCTVLLRFSPDAPWPLVLAAVRDEFVDRAWDPPAAHWPAVAPGVIGGRDRTAGGTWLAVRPDPPAVSALLNGVRRPVPADHTRPSRGALSLSILTGGAEPDAKAMRDYDGFHLLLGSPDSVVVWSWDGVEVARTELAPGDHVIVNAGVDTVDDPLVPHFRPLLGQTDLGSTVDSFWGGWPDLLQGDHLAPDDPRALLVRVEHDGRSYGSTSATLVALTDNAVRYDFTPTPLTPHWTHVVP